MDDRELPEPIQRCLDAHDLRDTERALSAFASDAVVTHEDRRRAGAQ